MTNERDQLSRRQKRDAAQITADMTEVFNTGSGRRVLRWLLERSGMFLPSYDAGFDAGRRDFGLEIVEVINTVDAYAFVKLMHEGATDLERRKAEAGRTTDVDDY